MIVSLDKYRKSKATRITERSGYLDRSTYEEAMLSAKWARAEDLMQLLDVSWNEAIRMISVSHNKRGRELSSQ